jgi:hypothetical protein
MVLTPYHILQGLRQEGKEGTLGAAMFLSLSTLGMGLKAGEPTNEPTMHQAPLSAASPDDAVKMEEG